jgi:hypothetical protein
MTGKPRVLMRGTVEGRWAMLSIVQLQQLRHWEGVSHSTVTRNCREILQEGVKMWAGVDGDRGLGCGGCTGCVFFFFEMGRVLGTEPRTSGYTPELYPLPLVFWGRSSLCNSRPWTYYITQAGLELVILLLLSPEGWECVPPHLVPQGKS